MRRDLFTKPSKAAKSVKSATSEPNAPVAGSRPKRGQGKTRRDFLIEPLEPRVRFSADLAPAAHALMGGLADLQTSLDAVGSVPAADPSLPFIHKSAED